MTNLPRSLVVLCDGTSNEVKTDLSNVLKFYRMLVRDDDQHVFYDPGVGTMDLARSWGRTRQDFETYLGLTTGWGIDEKILTAYRFVCAHYRDGDRIFVAGFSRGAYTARAVAGLIGLIGLLRPDQDNLAPYALGVYKRVNDADNLDDAFQFARVVGARHVPIRFLGLWDTVASILVPRQDHWLPIMQFLPYTKNNPCVAIVRHACAIDERRRMFRLYPWADNQAFKPDPFAPSAGPQDYRAVWFAGVHADIGGGYSEKESGAAKFPLLWLAREAEKAGLRLNESMVAHLAEGTPLLDGRQMYVPPDPTAPIHDSSTGLWRLLEWLPRKARWRQWPLNANTRGWYLPRGEPRPIPLGATVDQSVIDRMAMTDYRPINLPADPSVER